MDDLLPYLYFLGALLFLSSTYYFAERQLGRNFYHPVVLFCIFYSLVFFILPGLEILTKTVDSRFSSQTLFISFLLLFVFGAAVVATFLLMRGQNLFVVYQRRNSQIGHWKALNPKILTLSCLVLLIPSFAAYAYQLVVIRQNGGFSAFLAKRILLNSGEGYLQMPNQWFLVVLVIYLANALIERNQTGKRPNWTVITLLTLASVSTGVMQASRTRTLLPFILIAITLAVFRNTVKVKKVNTGKIILAGVCILTAGVILGPVRQAYMGKRIQHAVKAVSKLNTSQTALESFNEYTHVWWLVQHRGSFRPLYGQTFEAIAGGLIPRKLWPDKPLGGGPVLLNLMNPGAYDLSSEKTHSPITPGLPAESDLNFGFYGFPLLGMVYGVILVWLTGFMRRVDGPFAFALWSVVLWRAVEAIHGEAFGEVGNTFIVVAPIILVIGIYKLMLHLSTNVAGNLRRAQMAHNSPKASAP